MIHPEWLRIGWPVGPDKNWECVHVKVAFVTETWLPSTDGVVTRLTSTIRQLRAAGHEVLVIAPRDGSDPAASEFLDVPVKLVPSFGLHWLYGGKRWGWPLPRIDRWLRDFDPDVVHAVNPLLMGVAGVIAARLRRRPLVASFHTDIVRYARYYRLGWLEPVIWGQLRWLHGRARVNLATSGATCDQLRQRRIPRVSLWRRGVDLDVLASHFDGRRRIGEQVVVPVGVTVGTGLRGEHEVSPAIREVHHRVDPLATGPGTTCVQQEQRRPRTDHRPSRGWHGIR